MNVLNLPEQSRKEFTHKVEEMREKLKNEYSVSLSCSHFLNSACPGGHCTKCKKFLRE